MQQYYRLMKSILFVLFLSFGMISCEKEDPVSTSPTTRQTDDSTTDPTDPDPTDPVVRSNNEQTVFMYLPWSNNLTSFFYQNIADLKSACQLACASICSTSSLLRIVSGLF